MRTFAAAALLPFALLLVGSGCDPSGTAPIGDSAALADGSSGRTTANASATAIPSAAAPGHPQAGRWVAELDAVRGTITLPRGVPYKWWDKDDGQAATGKSKVQLEISEQGAVSGSAQGALGELVLRGAIEDGTLRAGVFPAEEGGQAMSGVLVGELAGDAIEGELRVSSHDASLARRADVRLSRQP